MKMKMTRKQVFTVGGKVVEVGNNKLHSLLLFHEPIGYNAGYYGWNFDVYEVYGLVICTGYRNTPGEKLENVEAYESKALEVLKSNKSPLDIQEEIEKLLHEFCILNGGF